MLKEVIFFGTSSNGLESSKKKSIQRTPRRTVCPNGKYDGQKGQFKMSKFSFSYHAITFMSN